ncbi:MAG TPA: glucose-1-phosphate adenylyltransferase [Nitrospiria bacterium]
MRNVLALILAGGKGARLSPLTLNRAKPAVPFGGHYRIIDFTLSNCLNSGIRKIAVLTQYKSLSLDRHIRMGWSVVNPELGEFLISLPPQQRVSQDWYRGTADAVFQNLYFIQQEEPDHLFVLSGDHIYKMDYAEMLSYHEQNRADVTLATIEVDPTSASRFGILEMDEDHRVLSFEEKPKGSESRSQKRPVCHASMGVYLFNVKTLESYLKENAERPTEHDFGRNILPQMVKETRVFGYEFLDQNKKTVKYWRDIGTLNAYWEANMDLVSVEPLFNLYDQDWPVRTYHGQYPPAKFVFAEEFKDGRLGIALDSIVCNGNIISGARLQHSVLSPNVRIEDHSLVENSVIMENVMIGRHCRIRKAILDKDVHLPEKTEIGYDEASDKKRFTTTETGIVVVTKEMLSG